MKCERCGQREASYFYKEIINGKETRANLCNECASMKESGFLESDFFSGGLWGQMFAPVPKKAPRSEKRCSLCGGDFSQIAKSGKVGCPQCYRDFAPLLEDALKRLHGNACHKGKYPREYEKKLGAARLEQQLREQLRQAVAAEEYEKAAELRDKLRSLGENS